MYTYSCVCVLTFPPGAADGQSDWDKLSVFERERE